MLNSSRGVKDLSSPPGNRLESLKGDLKGYYSVRINERWRLVFQWQGADAYEARIVDYHRG
jgi:proteic killer suppression protein